VATELGFSFFMLILLYVFLPAALSTAQSSDIKVTQAVILRPFAPSVNSSVPNFTPSVQTPKLIFLLRIYQNSEYKRPSGAHPLRDFHEIYRVCTSFQDALTVDVWTDL